MLRNYFKIALRSLLRDKAFSFINIIGLAVGIACCIVITLFVHDELSYDTFNTRADRIYRPTLRGVLNGHDIMSAASPAGMGPALRMDLPDVAAYTRIRNFGASVLRNGENAFSEDKFLGVDSTFFDVFTVRFLEGNPARALTQPNSVVMTASMARKYFGTEDPVGKVLILGADMKWTVTGVVEDWPRNSHLKFDFLASLTTANDSRNPTWLSNNYYTYLLLRNGANPVEFQKKLDQEVIKYASPQLKSSIGMNLEQLRANGSSYGFALQPLSSIHLDSHLDYEIEPNSDRSYVYIFSAIAIAILLIACTNFINLATARSERRAREVGIRKTLGSNRSRIVGQFLAESVLMSSIAVLFAVILVEMLLPMFNEIAGKKMSLDFFETPATILVLLGFAAGIGIVAGIYPAFYLSSFQPTEVLARDSRRGSGRSFLRGGLVVFQFSVSIILLIATFVISSQLRYAQSKDLGFDKDQLIVIERTNELSSRLPAFEQELRTNSRILGVTNSTAIPGNQKGDGAYELIGRSAHQYENLREMWCDYDFAETYNIRMAEGRFFSREHPSDTAAVVVNEAAAKTYGEKNVTGKFLSTPRPAQQPADNYQVIGTIKDFNFQSLHEPMRPLVIHFASGNTYAGRFITVRISPGNPDDVVSFLEGEWKKYAGNGSFSYTFMDQNLQRLYSADQKTGKIASLFSIIAIFVACLGLLGLAAFVTERRIKEIGIRKVLGASVPEVVTLLSAQFAKWVLIANVIAWPLAYYFMNNWLKNFAYRIEIGIWIFLVSGAMALVIALLTVSAHAIKAATANPVESLRYE